MTKGTNLSSSALTVAITGANDQVMLPNAGLLFSSVMERIGDDLVVTGADGQVVVLTGYFLFDPPLDLTAPGNAVLSADLINLTQRASLQGRETVEALEVGEQLAQAEPAAGEPQISAEALDEFRRAVASGVDMETALDRLIESEQASAAARGVPADIIERATSQFVTELFANLNSKMTVEEAVADAERVFRGNGRAVSETGTDGGADALIQALASGQAVEAAIGDGGGDEAGFNEALGDALARGESVDQALTKAEDAAKLRVEVKNTEAGDKVLAALASGEGAAEIIDSLASGDQATFNERFAEALAQGLSPDAAANQAQTSALRSAEAKEAAAEASKGGPLEALASGQVGDGALTGLDPQIAGLMETGPAPATGPDTSPMAALASGRGVDQAIAQLSGGATSDAFEQSFGETLATGADVTQASSQAATAASANAAANATADTSLLAALASGRNVEQSLGANGNNQGAAFETALSDALSSGAAPTQALGQAAARAATNQLARDSVAQDSPQAALAQGLAPPSGSPQNSLAQNTNPEPAPPAASVPGGIAPNPGSPLASPAPVIAAPVIAPAPPTPPPPTPPPPTPPPAAPVQAPAPAFTPFTSYVPVSYGPSAGFVPPPIFAPLYIPPPVIPPVTRTPTPDTSPPPPPPPNLAPLLSNPGAQAIAEGGTVSITLSGRDPEGSPLSFSATSSNDSLLANSGITILGNTLTLTPGADAFGTSLVTVTARDAQGAATSTSFELAVSNVQDAPVLNNAASPALTGIDRNNTTSAGTAIAAMVVDGAITDVDGDAAEAIAVTAVDNSNGTWQYKLNGGNWAAVDDGSLAENHALLLDSADSLRFVPNANYVGSQNVTFRAWDKTSGTAGTYADTTTNGNATAYSTATDTASLVVDGPPAMTAQALSLSRGAAPITLTSNHLLAADLSGPSDLTFTIGTAVSGGTLAKSGAALGANATFTQADVNAGLISYTHFGGTGNDSFTFKVTDGNSEELTNQTFAITSNASNAPTDIHLFNNVAGSYGTIPTTRYDYETDRSAQDTSISMSLPVTWQGTNNASLTIRAYDIELTENDKVYFNGHYLGELDSTGNANWGNTTFSISPSWIVAGTNTILIDVEQNFWMKTDYARLTTSGGTGPSSTSITTNALNVMGFEVSGSTVALADQASVTASQSGTYKIEVELLATNGSTVLDSSSKIVSLSAGQDYVFDSTHNYSLGAASGTYTLRTTTYHLDSGTYDGQRVYSKTFSHTQNTGPSVTGANTIAETASANTLIAILGQQDADDGQSHTYSLADDNGGRYALVTNSRGQTELRTGATAIDYETVANHDVRIKVTDAAGLSYYETVTVGVSNVNEAPSDITLSASSVNENVASGTVVATLGATDVDSSRTAQTHSFAITSDPDSKFSIVGNELRVNGALDTETKSSHQVTVRVTDQGGLTYDETLTIGITDINDAPVASLAAAATSPSMVFNGAGTTSGTAPAANAALGAITLEAWVKMDALSGSEPILHFQNGATEGAQLWNWGGGGNLHANLIDTGGTSHTLNAAGALTADTWQHVAITYDKSHGFATLFVDGAQVARSYVGSFDVRTGTELLMGNAKGSAVNGGLDDVRFWSVERSAAEIAQSLSSDVTGTAGLTGSWTMDALTNGTTIADGGTGGNNATFTNGALADRSATPSYGEGGSAITFLPAITISDQDATGTTLSAATMSITGNFTTGDALAFTTQNGISGSFNAATGVLSLTGSATHAAYKTALESVTFSSTSDQPTSTGATRTISTVLDDGGAVANTSNTVTTTLNVVNVNDAPVLDASGSPALTQTEQATASTTTVSSLLTGAVSDGDANALSGIAVTSADGTNGTWEYSLNGTDWSALGAPSESSARLLASTAQLRFTGNGAWSGTAEIAYRAWDQTSGSNGATANVSATGGSTAFSTASETASVLVNAKPTLGAAETSLVFADSFDSLSTTTWHVGGTAVHATPSTDNGGGLARLSALGATYTVGSVISKTAFSSADGMRVVFDYYSGGNTSGDASERGDGLAFFLLDGSTASPTTGPGAQALGYSPADGNNGLSNAYMGVGFDEWGNFSGLGNPSNAVALRGPGNGTTGYDFLTRQTVADLDAGWHKVDFTLSSDRKVTLRLSYDGGTTWTNVFTDYDYAAATGTALPGTLKFGFAGANGGATNNHDLDDVKVFSADVPVFWENGAVVAVNSGVTLSEPDGEQIASARVTISGWSSSETLAFTTANGITGAFADGTLTLTGNASAAQYQEALRSVTYSNSSEAITNATRAITMNVTDSTGRLSDTISTDLGIAAVNDAVGHSGTLGYTVTKNVATASAFGFSDSDGDTLTYTVNTGPQHGTLTSANGLLTYTPTTGHLGGDSFVVTASDGITTLQKTIDVVVKEANDTPIAASAGGAATAALNFASGAYLQSAQSVALTSFTFESWVKTSDMGSAWTGIVSTYGAAAGDTLPFAQMAIDASGNLVAEIHDGSGATNTLISTAQIADNGFHHVALSFDDPTNVATLFVDGASVASATMTIDAFTINNTIQIGQDRNLATPTHSFDGLLDEVRVWNTARSETEIKTNMARVLEGTEAGLVDYWDFSDTATDRIGSGGTTPNVLQAVTGGGSITQTTGPTLTAGNYGLSLDGTGDVAGVSGISLANASFSWEFWARRDSSGTVDTVLGQGTATDYQGLQIGYGADNSFAFGFSGNALTYTDSDSNVNEWVHWAGTYDAGTNARILYKNGAQVAADAPVSDYSGTGAFNIGAGYSTPADYFDGTLDEVRLWSDVRSATEIGDNFTKRVTGGESDLYAAWHFDETSGAVGSDATSNNFDLALTGDAAWENLVNAALGNNSSAAFHVLGSETETSGAQSFTLIGAQGGATKGTASIDSSTGVLTYSASATTGADSISYQITDAGGATATGVIEVTVT